MGTNTNQTELLSQELIEKLESNFDWEELDWQCHGTEGSLKVLTGEQPSITISVNRLDPRRQPGDSITIEPGKQPDTSMVSGNFQSNRGGYREPEFTIGVCYQAVAQEIARPEFRGRGSLCVWRALELAGHRAPRCHEDDENQIPYLDFGPRIMTT